jgi:hypothetical protein
MVSSIPSPSLPLLLLLLLLALSSLTTITATPDPSSPLPTIHEVLTAADLSSYIPLFDEAGLDQVHTLLKMKRLDVLNVPYEMKEDEIKRFLATVKELVPPREKNTDKKKSKLDEALAKRQSLSYGKVYIDGSTKDFNFQKALFGGHVPSRAHQIVVAGTKKAKEKEKRDEKDDVYGCTGTLHAHAPAREGKGKQRKAKLSKEKEMNSKKRNTRQQQQQQQNWKRCYYYQQLLSHTHTFTKKSPPFSFTILSHPSSSFSSSSSSSSSSLCSRRHLRQR